MTQVAERSHAAALENVEIGVVSNFLCLFPGAQYGAKGMHEALVITGVEALDAAAAVDDCLFIKRGPVVFVLGFFIQGSSLGGWIPGNSVGRVLLCRSNTFHNGKWDTAVGRVRQFGQACSRVGSAAGVLCEMGAILSCGVFRGELDTDDLMA